MSLLPTAGCSAGRTGLGMAAQRRHSLEHSGTGRSSSVSLRPCLCCKAGWGELRMERCSPSLVPALPEGVLCCNREKGHGHSLSQEREERKKCPDPLRRMPSQLPRPHHPPCTHPTPTPGLRDLEQVTSAAAIVTRSDQLPEPGRAWEKPQWMALGWALGAADDSPQSSTQHHNWPCLSLHTLQTSLAGVQTRARLARAL